MLRSKYHEEGSAIDMPKDTRAMFTAAARASPSSAARTWHGAAFHHIVQPE